MTDSRLLAEARIIARLKVSRMSEGLGFGPIRVYKTPEDLSVGSEMLTKHLQIQRIKLNRLALAAKEAKQSMMLFNARMKAVQPVQFIDPLTKED